MAERADMCFERTDAQLLLLGIGDAEKRFEKFLISSFPCAGVTHLRHLLHELANGRAVLEWAASFESRAREKRNIFSVFVR